MRLLDGSEIEREGENDNDLKAALTDDELIRAVPVLYVMLRNCITNHCRNEKLYCSSCTPAREVLASLETNLK